MEPDDEEELGRLRMSLRRLRTMTWVKLAITLVIILGIAVHLVLVYNAAKQLEMEGVTVTSIEPEDVEGDYKVTFTLTIRNPTSTTIDVDRITYVLHLEEDLLGRGEKRDFEVAPGTEGYEFSVTFNVADLAGSTATLFLEETATLRVSGEVTVPAKVFGLWRYTTITVPYSEEKEISSGGGGDHNPAPLPVLLAPPTYRPTASAHLTWSQSGETDFARYEVHTSTDPDFVPSASTLAGTVSDQATTEYIVGGLSHLTTHYFRVRVYDQAGQHADSNLVSIFIP